MNTESLSTPSDCISEFPPDAAPAVRVEMVFRLWAPARDPGTRGPGQSAAQHPGVLALIADAAASKRGVFQATDGQLFVSGLKKTADALVISRQIQLGLQGFRSGPGAHPVAVSIAIDASSGAASTPRPETSADAKLSDLAGASSAPARKAPEPSHDLLTLLKLAKPAQILITHDAWQRIAEIKGLPLKSFPGRFGVYEYLWTAEDKLNLFQSEPQLTLTVLPAALSPTSESRPGKDVATQTIAADSMPESPGAEERGTSAAEQKKRDGFRLPRQVLVAGVAVAACGIAIAGWCISHVFFSGSPTSNAPASIQEPPQPLTATPNAPATAAAKPAGPTASPRSSRKTLVASTAQTKMAKPKAAKPAAAVEETPIPPPAPSPECAFAGDTARLASLGEQDRERGDYTNAERIFRQVLACDPNNATAREGLNRTIEGEQQSRRRP